MPPLPGDVVWFPNEIRKLIEAIKKQEGIFNPRHPDFGLREALAKAWREVAALVGGDKTDAQCRDKWNCLRGTYRRHVRTEATNSVKRRSGWPWTEHLTFIKKYVMDKDELAELEMEAIRKGRKPPPTDAQAKRHKPNCPMKSPPVTATTNSGSTAVAFKPGGIYSGGIIFNRAGIGIVQRNQTGTIGIVQPSPANLGLRLAQPLQSNVGLSLVQTTQGKILVRTNQPSVAVTKPLEVDMNVKKDQDESKLPAKTEFVDMEDIVVKKEPLDEDEIDLPDFNFLPEESSQDSNREDQTEAKDVADQPTPDPINTTTNEQSGSSEPDDESTQLFMRSTVAHMKQLSAYDQSVFKLKVQQLLHDMMFPSETRASQN